MYRTLQTVMCTALAAMAAGPTDLPVDLERGAHDCLQAMYGGRPAAALDTADALCARHPGHPAALLLRVSALQTQLTSSNSREAEREFYGAADMTAAAAEVILAKRPDDYWASYALAGANGAKALHELDQKRWLPAIRHAWAGVSVLRKMKQAYPFQIDLEFGIGCYEYWVTRYAGMSGSRGGAALQGIKRLYQVKDQGDFARLPAASQLIKILVTERRLDDARCVAAQMGLELSGDAGVAETALVVSTQP